eukprot:RCo002542
MARALQKLPLLLLALAPSGPALGGDGVPAGLAVRLPGLALVPQALRALLPGQPAVDGAVELPLRAVQSSAADQLPHRGNRSPPLVPSLVLLLLQDLRLDSLRLLALPHQSLQYFPGRPRVELPEAPALLIDVVLGQGHRSEVIVLLVADKPGGKAVVVEAPPVEAMFQKVPLVPLVEHLCAHGVDQRSSIGVLQDSRHGLEPRLRDLVGLHGLLRALSCSSAGLLLKPVHPRPVVHGGHLGLLVAAAVAAVLGHWGLLRGEGLLRRPLCHRGVRLQLVLVVLVLGELALPAVLVDDLVHPVIKLRHARRSRLAQRLLLSYRGWVCGKLGTSIFVLIVVVRGGRLVWVDLVQGVVLPVLNVVHGGGVCPQRKLWHRLGNAHIAVKIRCIERAVLRLLFGLAGFLLLLPVRIVRVLTATTTAIPAALVATLLGAGAVVEVVPIIVAQDSLASQVNCLILVWVEVATGGNPQLFVHHLAQLALCLPALCVLNLSQLFFELCNLVVHFGDHGKSSRKFSTRRAPRGGGGLLLGALQGLPPALLQRDRLVPFQQLLEVKAVRRLQVRARR